MKRLTLISFSVVLLLVGMTPVVWADAEEEVRQAIAERRKALTEGNAEAMAAFYAEDAHHFPGANLFRAVGRDAIEAAYTGLFTAFPTVRIAYRETSIRIYNDTTAAPSEYFTATLIDKDGNANRFQGRHTMTWVKTDGRWLIVNQHISALPGAGGSRLVPESSMR